MSPSELYTNTWGRLSRPPALALPLINTDPESAVEIQLNKRYDDIVAVLAQYGLPNAELEFTHRVPSVKCEGGYEALRRPDNLTVFIKTSIDTREGTQWNKVVDEVCCILKAEGFPEARCEIVAQELYAERFAGAVPLSHPAHSESKAFDDAVVEILDSDPCLKGKWCSLSVITYGYHRDTDRNPPTLLILVDKDDFIEADADDARSKIKSLVSANQLDLRVWFEEGTVSNYIE